MEKKKSSLISVAALILLILAGTWFREHDGAKDGLEQAAGELAEKIRDAKEKTDAAETSPAEMEDSLKTLPPL